MAAGQFPVSHRVRRNLAYIKQQIQTAADLGARVVLFPETALCGYAPALANEVSYAWSELDAALAEVAQQAAARHIWVLLGSVHCLPHQYPHNSLYAISSTGDIVGRYDKRSLYKGEQHCYSAGAAGCVLEIDGVRCGLLICFDNCFPQLYHEYQAQGVQVVFHALHNAGSSTAKRGAASMARLMDANARVRAADHGFWVCAANSSARYSPMPAIITRPDGSARRARRHVADVIWDDLDANALGWTYA